MEVAEQIVVHERRPDRAGRHRRASSTSSPRTSSSWASSGRSTELGDALVRPHDLEILRRARTTARSRRWSSGSCTSASRCAWSSRSATGSPSAPSSPATRPSELELARRRRSSRCAPDAPSWSQAGQPGGLASSPGVRLARRARARARQRAPHDVGERQVLEHAAQARAQRRPRRLKRLGRPVVVERLGRLAAHAGERALDRADHVGHRDLVGRLAPASSRRRARAGCATSPAWRRSMRMFSRNLSGMPCACGDALALDGPSSAAASSRAARTA